MNENRNVKYLFKVKDQVIFFVKHIFLKYFLYHFKVTGLSKMKGNIALPEL